ncbi:MAG: hypothetical protein PVG35_21740 [Desulfobacterales bacterium]|jgi:hypothetical protein
MQFTCTMCEAGGEIPEDELAHPVTRTTCRHCGTILLIDPDTGKVDAHKSPLKDASTIKTLGDRAADASPSVLPKRPQDRAARDWLAPVVVVIVVFILISVGVYVAINLEIL